LCAFHWFHVKKESSSDDDDDNEDEDEDEDGIMGRTSNVRGLLQ